MTFGTTLEKDLTMAAYAYMFLSPLTVRIKRNTKIATSNINIKIFQLFPKQLIVGFRVIILQS